MTCVEIDREALAAEVYASSVRYAMSLARKMGWEMEEAAINAATDAVLWCLDRAERQEVKDWPKFVRGNVKKFVGRAKQKLWDKRSNRGETQEPDNGPKDDEPFDLDKLPTKPYTSPEGRLDFELADTLATRDGKRLVDRSEISHPPALAQAAQLLCIYGMSQREAAVEMGVSKGTFGNLLKEASRKIGGSRPMGPRGNMKKKFKR